jgi:hypothetical protein
MTNPRRSFAREKYKHCCKHKDYVQIPSVNINPEKYDAEQTYVSHTSIMKQGQVKALHLLRVLKSYVIVSDYWFLSSLVLNEHENTDQ